MVSTTRDKEVFLLAPGKHPNTTVPEPPRGRGSILVVEDDAPTLRLERVLLEEAGYSVEVVASGEEAIEAVLSLRPALVLLDIGLPGMDGFATCQRIREFSRVPIIMVTGRDCLDDKVKGMNVGADDYVTKPFLTHELATRVKVILRRAAESAPPPYLAGAAPPAPPAPSAKLAAPTASSEPAPPLPPAATADQGQPQSPPEAAPTEAPEQLEQQPQAPEPVAQGNVPNAPSEEPAPAPVPPPAPTATPAPASGTVYEGTVRLSVTTQGPVSNLIGFVSELRQNPHYRLLRLVANQQQEGMDIWLGLREPVALLSSLKELRGVVEVTSPVAEGPASEEPLLRVLLK